MGKFEGVLFMTDYDNTFYGGSLSVPERNRRAARYFMDQGGRFSFATGRAYSTFTPQIQREGLEFNAPVVLSNGAAVYDYEAGRYLAQTHLPRETTGRLLELCKVFPDLGLETYHGKDIYVYRANAVTQAHLTRVGSTWREEAIQKMPGPWTKVLLEQDAPYLEEVQRYFSARWGEFYEIIFSNPCLLEVTAKGCHKGTMVAEVARRLGVAPEHVYCAGDNQNDIPMLEISAIPFAPADCNRHVKAWGARLLCDSDAGAIADAVEILDRIY